MYNDILNNLLSIQEKIYDLFIRFIDVDKESDELYSIVGSLERLSLEEDNILSIYNFDLSPTQFELLKMNYLSASNDVSKSIFVLSRFNYVLFCINNNDEIRSIRTKFYKGFIKYLRYNNDKIAQNFSFKTAFVVKEISDDLIKYNCDISKIDSYDYEPFLKKINIDRYSYNKLYYQFVKSECLDVLIDITNNHGFYFDLGLYSYVAYNASILKYLLINMDDVDFQNIRYYFDSNLSLVGDSSWFIIKLKDIFNSVYKERYGDIFNESKTCYIDDETMEKIISLFKLEKVLLSKYESDNDDSIISLLEFETNIKNSIIIDDNNHDAIYNVIDNDIDFFVDCTPKEIYLIKNRIFNMFSEFYYVSPNSISKSYELILHNHILRTASLNDYYMAKQILFMYPSINLDFLVDYDDDLSGVLLGYNSSLNYVYDKNEQLYYLGVKLIKDLCEIEGNNDLDDIFNFKLLEFDDIINNVSDEYLFLLEEGIINSSLKCKDRFHILKELENKYTI